MREAFTHCDPIELGQSRGRVVFVKHSFAETQSDLDGGWSALEPDIVLHVFVEGIHDRDDQRESGCVEA